jgi:beta-glucanase (GH16 family)
MRTNISKVLLSAGVLLALTLGVASSSSATTYAKAPNLKTTNFDKTPDGPLLWSETFNDPAGTSPTSSIWTPVTGSGPQYGTGEVENNTNSTTNLEEDGSGNLLIIAHCIATTSPGCEATQQGYGSTWTSARIWTYGKKNFKYGQLEARIWMPRGSYNWPAFWMMGASYTSGTPQAGQENWPMCGELDIAEGLHGNTKEQATIHANMPGTSSDWADGSGLTQTAPITGSAMTSGWHTYGILWKPNSISYTLDGKVWATDTYNPHNGDITTTQGGSSATYGPTTPFTFVGGDWPFNKPFFIILNNAIGGVSSPVAPNGSTSTMKVNWIHYYKYEGYGSVSA